MTTPAAAADDSPSAATAENPAAAAPPAEKQDSAAEQGDSGDGDGEPSRVEVPLLYIKEVFVYRVPPAKAASGHRAEEWGLENPALTGFMRISQLDDQCLVKMFVPPKEGDLGAAAQLFATCCIRVGGGRFLQHFVEHVMDSSRYFVLRCEDQAGSGRVAYVGVGFRERSTAFDFKAALDDYVRSVQRQQQAERLRERANSVDAAVAVPTDSYASRSHPDASWRASAAALPALCLRHKDEPPSAVATADAVLLQRVPLKSATWLACPPVALDLQASTVPVLRAVLNGCRHLGTRSWRQRILPYSCATSATGGSTRTSSTGSLRDGSEVDVPIPRAAVVRQGLQRLQQPRCTRHVTLHKRSASAAGHGAAWPYSGGHAATRP
eukprot:TRINITY_DN2072_c0_g1_i5.p1 TRINITY_DN2072_c0_g1~~TRINITY_DN2072_c0_g1_i5.p1  ORF type:complete len:411 (+),score=83.06 TRINITY_DN2072_c0_g1_i5:92-1234(+)